MAIDIETKELLLTICAVLRHQLELQDENRRALLAIRRTLIETHEELLQSYEMHWQKIAALPAHSEPTSHLLQQLSDIVQKLKV